MVLQMLSYGLLFFLMVQVSANRERSRVLLQALTWLIAVYGVLGLFMLTQLGDTWFGLPKEAYPGSATGPFVNRNSFATFLAFGLAIDVALLLEAMLLTMPFQDRLLRVLLLLVLTGITAVSLVATNSRMGSVAGLAGVLAVIALGSFKIRLTAGKWLILGVSFLAAGGLLMFTMGTGVLERVVTLDSAIDVRGDLYAQILGMIARRPWLGYGGGSFEFAYPLFHQLPVSVDGIWEKAHSTYLGLWLELGVVVGSLPLLIVLWTGAQALRAFLTSSRYWVTGLAGIGVLVVAAVHSTVDFSLEIPAVALLFTALVALPVGQVLGRRSQGHGSDMVQTGSAERR
jgi:O-antigen ligase